jgi:PAS domain S-box-containing protein
VQDRSVRVFVWGVAVLTGLVTASVLVGWLTLTDVLTRVIPGGARMVPATALGFLLCAAALVSFVLEPPRPKVARGCAVAVLVLGAERLVGYWFGTDGFEFLGLASGIDSSGVPLGHMSPATALAFMLLGVALLMSRAETSARAFQAVTLLALLVGWLGFTRYLYGGQPLLPLAAMAFHTATLFILLSVATLTLRKDAGLIALVSGVGAGGAITRRLLPTAVLLPVLLAWFPAYALHVGWMGPEAGLSVLAGTSVIVFGALVWSNAALLERTDHKRHQEQEAREAVERRTELIVEKNQAYLQILTETVPNLVWTCKSDGSCDFLSLQWAQYTGKPAAQQLGWAWLDQLHADDRSRISQEWIRAVVGKRAYETEFRIRRADGAYRWFQTRAQAVRDEAGEITYWIGSSTDIDDLKRAEQKLRTQLERLRLLDSSTRAIGSRQDPASVLAIAMATLEQEFAIDLTCACLYDAAAKVFLVESVGTRGAAVAEPPGIRKGAPLEVEARGLALCMQGQLVYEPHLQTESYTFPALAAAGFGSFVLAPLGAEGKVQGALVAARSDPEGFSSDDCEFLRQLSHHLALALNQAELYSALQSAYEDLRQTQQRSIQEERLRALGQMASGIAHDINNALAPATLYLDILREHDKQLSEVSRERLGLVQRAVESVASTVGRMREFYRSGGADLDNAPLAVNPLIEHAIALTRARWDDMPKEQGLVIQVQTELGAGLPDIMGSQSELRDAVTNLVLNAVDAMPGGGTLTLRSRSSESGCVCIDVSDTGVGMDTQTRLRCLEPFFTTKGDRGSGLGLAMVYGMLNRYSGEIEIDSTPGTGTRITLSFPPAPPDPQADSGQPVPQVPQRSMRILIIDDDPVVLRTMQSTLETDGHVVAAFDGGAKGLEAFLAQLNTQPYDVVITDLGMPYMDGRKVAAAVKGARPQTPVLLLTGWGQRMRAQDEHPEHVDRVLAKPPRLSELRQALAELVEER